MRLFSIEGAFVAVCSVFYLAVLVILGPFMWTRIYNVSRVGAHPATAVGSIYYGSCREGFVKYKFEVDGKTFDAEDGFFIQDNCGVQPGDANVTVHYERGNPANNSTDSALNSLKKLVALVVLFVLTPPAIIMAGVAKIRWAKASASQSAVLANNQR